MNRLFTIVSILTILVLSAGVHIREARSDGCPQWPDQATRNLTKADLQNCDCRELELLRNEIYARHGRRFNRKDLQEYFESQPWYKYDPKNPQGDKGLNAYEQKNAAAIASYEKQIGCRPGTAPRGGKNPWVKNETMGGIKLGASLDSITAKYGEPENTEGEGIVNVSYPSAGINFTIWDDGGARSIVIYGQSSAKTSKGIGVGSTRQEIIKAYGAPYWEENLGHGETTVDYSTGEEVCPYQLNFFLVNGRVKEITLQLDCA